MKPRVQLLWLLSSSLVLASSPVAFSGTWTDDFSGGNLGSDWQGDRQYFSIVDGALSGISASPLAPVPLHRVEVGKDWTDYTVQCRVDVVEPNLLICTKGALILRDNGTDGYVFALHVATATVEVYRLSNGEMLLSKAAPLELKRWYILRAELSGTNMSFYVDDKFMGTLADDRSLSGAVGVAVQDTMQTLFDDFAVTGPNIPNNGLTLSIGKQLTLTWPASLTNYVLKATSQLSSTSDWEAVTNTPATVGDDLSVTLEPSAGNRFFTLQRNTP